MKMTSIIINDKKANKYVAFMKQFPGVCAQGDSIKEVKGKIKKHFDYFIETKLK